MSQTEVGILGIVILAALLLIGMDVGYTMIIAGFVGFALIGGWGASLSNIAIVTYDRMSDYFFSAMPLFLLMGAFVSVGGLGREAYQIARAWLGHIRGGLAMATIGGSALFAGISGSSLAGSLVMGKVAYPEMRQMGYKRPLAAAVVSVGGTLGILIPPSTAFVLIGILAELSIGKLLLAGIIPGVLVTVFYILTVYVWTKFDPKVAPALAVTPTWRERANSLRLSWPIVILFLGVMGGIYFGIFTSVEAAAVGAFGALIIPLARRHMTAQAFWLSLNDTAKMTAMIIILIIGAFVYNSFLAITQIPNNFGVFLTTLPIGRWGVMVLIIIFFIIAGSFFDPYSILILTIPIFYPAVHNMGFDLIWYSVLMVRLIEVGNISPPAGINLFGLKGVIDAPMTDIYKGVIPFLICDVLSMALLVAFPVISTILPDTIR